jgi:hypothetical protein
MLAAVLAAALLSPACGGGGGGGNGGGAVVGPTGPSRAVITEQGWQLEPLSFSAVDISITGSGSGSVEATVEWTFASDDVDLYVTATACTTAQFAVEACAYKAKADGTGTKPERVSFSVSAGDTYRFWIVNFGPQSESGTFQAVLVR